MHTTKLTALSAASPSNNENNMDTQDITCQDINISQDINVCQDINISLDISSQDINISQDLKDVCRPNQTESLTPIAKFNHLMPFFKAGAAAVPTPPTEQQQQEDNSLFQAYQQPTSHYQQPCRFSSLAPDADFTSSWVSSTLFPSHGAGDPLHFLAPRVILPTTSITTTTTSSTPLSSNIPHFVTPSLVRHERYPTFSSVRGASTLGRHWKQMGCQTRQYLQPTIPLPSSTRLAAAAKHLRGGGASLGGPPGSLSPLTPNKSWAQIVASSGVNKSTQQMQQMQNPPSVGVVFDATKPALMTAATGAHNRVRSLSFNNKARPFPPHASTHPRVINTSNNSRSAVRGLGAATSSDAHFKSLLTRLKTALDKEKEMWRPKDNKTKDAGNNHGIILEEETAIDGRHRDECIYWSAWVVRKCHFGSETAALSIALFDAFCNDAQLTSTDSKVTVLLCVLLAAKFCEEDADVPNMKDLLKVAEVEAQVSEAARRERLILDVLGWDINRVTPLKLLEILHALLLCHQPQILEDVALGLTPVKHLERLTWKMQRLTASHHFLAFRPAVIAVALLSVDLEVMDAPDWRLVTSTLEKIVRVEGQQLVCCRNNVARALGTDRSGKGATPEKSKRMKSTSIISSSFGAITKMKRKHVPSESSGVESLEEVGGIKAAEGRVTLKRFNAESPCKTEAREEDGEAERFAVRRGLCINIY